MINKIIIKLLIEINKTGEKKCLYQECENISTFTNPPIICIPLFLIICFYLSSSFNPSFSVDWGKFIVLEGISLVFISILPMAIILFWAKKLNTDKDISNRSDRYVPLLVGVVSYFIGFLVALALHLDWFLKRTSSCLDSFARPYRSPVRPHLPCFNMEQSTP